MSSPSDSPEAALHAALRLLAAPLARLCLARGVRFAQFEELLKQVFVQVAREALGDAGGTRDVSRVSTATGLNRREVTRLTQLVPSASAARSSPATRVFTRWLGERKLRDRSGRPRPLKRQGPAPSFEALAQWVTRDVHPRSLLDELCRLGLAELDSATDTVRLVREAFVPSDDRERLGFLGHNVGDHLAGAVANVLGDGRQHFEQAIFADELSQRSMQSARKLIGAQWQALLGALVPALEALIEEDRQAGRRADQRLRVGLYSYAETMSSPAPAAEQVEES
jgi:hypothetical protein